MSSTIELVPIAEGNRVTVKGDEKIIIGRGSSLGCNDKKISRQHAELFQKKDETLWIKPTHTNPVFYRPANGKKIQLTKDVEQELKEGDQFGLLPTTFFFRVSFSTDGNGAEDAVPSGSANNSTASASTSPSNEYETARSNSKTRKLPTWISKMDDRPSVKRQLSAEKNDDKSTKEPSTTSDGTAAVVPDKPSVPKSFDSESDDGFDSVAPKKLKSSDKHRPACPYGATCYRKNPAHRAEQSHPGDSDHEDEKGAKDNDDTDKPQCPYGKSCYRQNPEHKRDYKH